MFSNWVTVNSVCKGLRLQAVKRIIETASIQRKKVFLFVVFIFSMPFVNIIFSIISQARLIIEKLRGSWFNPAIICYNETNIIREGRMLYE